MQVDSARQRVHLVSPKTPGAPQLHACQGMTGLLLCLTPCSPRCSISIGLVVGRLASRLLEVETRFRNHFMCVIALGEALAPQIFLLQA